MARNSPLLGLNMRHRRPQHKWSQEERFVLCVMKRFFELKNKEIARIFNHIYRSKIRLEGFDNGLPVTTLSTQWTDLHKRSHKDWHAVHTDVSFAQGPVFFNHIIEKVRQAARSLQIGLVERARDITIQSQVSVTRPTAPTSRTQVITTSPSQVNNGSGPLRPIHSPVIDLEREVTPVPPSPEPQVPAPKQLISRTRSYKWQGTDNENPPRRPYELPKILWRFSNDESQGINHRSGYIASAFTNDIGNIPTPEERASEFPTWLEIHVRPRRIPSPFISTTIDPLIAIHRALILNKNSFVSIIDPYQICSRNIFYMNDLMKQYNIFTPGHRGTKEYVVWGTICRAAIVTSIRADSMLRIAEENPDIKAALQLDVISDSPNCRTKLYQRLKQKTFESDNAVGRTIGKFLRLIRLQAEFMDDVAKSLNTFWSFTTSDNTEDFLRGVHHGFQTTPAPTSPLPEDIGEMVFPSQSSVVPSQDQTQTPEDEFVIVDHDRQEDIARQSMDRLSIHDDTQQLPRSRQRSSSSSVLPSVTASTIATRTISVFRPSSESWIVVPGSRHSSLEALSSVEEEVESTHTASPARTPTPTPTPTPIGSAGDQVNPQTPTRCSAHHARSTSSTSTASQSSDSTIGQPTPKMSRFSEDRARVDRVLNHDWETFWDSLHNVASLNEN